MPDARLKNYGTFHHLGIAVKDFERSVKFYEGLGYASSRQVVDTLQKVELVMLTSEALPAIELIRPTGSDSPASRYLKYSDEAMYHICYEVSDLKKMLAALQVTHRVICVSGQKPAVLFGGSAVSFYCIQGVGLVEFLEMGS